MSEELKPTTCTAATATAGPASAPAAAPQAIAAVPAISSGDFVTVFVGELDEIGGEVSFAEFHGGVRARQGDRGGGGGGGDGGNGLWGRTLDF